MEPADLRLQNLEDGPHFCGNHGKDGGPVDIGNAKPKSTQWEWYIDRSMNGEFF